MDQKYEYNILITILIYISYMNNDEYGYMI
jgi:hypothetical protein